MSVLVDMARAAMADERLSDGALYGKLADRIEALEFALHTIVCNTEPDAIKHRDYEHLAQDICDCASIVYAPQ